MSRDESPLQVNLVPTEALSRRKGHRVMIELASEAMALIVITLVDAYYLMRRSNYDELLDEFLARRGVTALWTDLPELPLKMIKDPGYHLLHKARRLVSGGDLRLVGKVLVAAFQEIQEQLPEGAKQVGTVEEIATTLSILRESRRVPNQLVLFFRKALSLIGGLPNDVPGQSALARQLRCMMDSGLLPFDEQGRGSV